MNPHESKQFRISKARQSQSTLLSSKSRCSVNEAVMTELGCEPGQQLRIHPTGDPGQAAAYTIDHVHSGSTEIRMGQCARKVIGETDPFDGIVRTTVPRPDLSYSEAWESDDIWETAWDNGHQDTFIVCAPHGEIESNTAQAAGIVRKWLGEDRASAWMVRAWGPESFDKWHVTSTAVSPAAFPELGRLADRGFQHALSFHVYNQDAIEVGGLADREFRERLADRIRNAIDGKREVLTDHDEMKYGATTRENFINWITEDGTSGVQIELTPKMAQRYRKRIARAVARFYDDEIADSGPESHTESDDAETGIPATNP